MRKIVFVICILGIFGGCHNSNKNVIEIGAILPLTGNAAETGDHIKKALELCCEIWNKKGGVCKKKITTIYFDNKGESKQGPILANQIISTTNIEKIIGTYSGVSLSAQPIFERNKILQLNFVASNEIVNKNTHYTLRCYPSTLDISNEFIKTIKNKFGKNKFIFFYSNTDFGVAYKKDIEKAANFSDGIILKEVIYEETASTYRDLITKQNLNNEDIIFIAGQYRSLGLIIKQLRESGFEGCIIGDTHINSPSVTNILGDNKENIFYVSIKLSKKATAIKNNYKNKYGIEMDEFSLLVYNGLDMLLNYMNEKNLDSNEEIIKNIDGYNFKGIMETSVINKNVNIQFEFKSL